jgi:RimJ/RimL family protein N-acetyltransferase
MPALTPINLTGNKIRLTPLHLRHQTALCDVGLDERIWRLTTIQVTTPDEMRQYICTALDEQANGSALPFVIEESQTGKVIGCTRFHSYHESNRRIEIGFTWLGVPWQRTGANIEAKLLMLRHAFETVGCVRVQFTADVANTPSRHAIERLSATHEGILRSYKISARNGPRDLAIYSILAAEWPAVRAILEERLASR